MLDEVLDGLGRSLSKLFKWLLIDFVIDFLFHRLGYVTLKILTLGKYPKSRQDNKILCSLVGVGAFVVMILLYVWLK